MRAISSAVFLLACSHAARVPEMKADDKPLEFSNPPGKAPGLVRVSFAIESEQLVVHFKVETKAIHAKPELARKEYPYDFDVVEVFVTNSTADKPRYYEFEVSPYDQALQVNVIDPRQEYYFGVKNGFAHAARVTPRGWEADMRIPLASLGWQRGQALHLRGNAYAALGEGDARVYWSLFELPPGTPDFHIPSAFRPLF